MPPAGSNVRVICRFRPMNKREEREQGSALKLQFDGEDTVTLILTGQPKQSFSFDAVFAPSTPQVSVYEHAARPSIDDVLRGFNSTIFAYGQTGSGKTYTMLGPSMSDREMWGIIPRAAAHIFAHISASDDNSEWTLKCSYLEIYKEVINDLLDPMRTRLEVHENPTLGVYVKGLSEEYVQDEDHVMMLLESGGKNRATSATDMNAVSSRSHSVFILYVTKKMADGSSASAKLNLVDLAGSEKVGKTGATGETLEEAKKINQSLSALGNCIHALTEAKRGHVPFRDSKLTRILQESLGGNCKTTLLVACSPHEFNAAETVSTLKFAQRAKTITLKARANVQRSAAELEKIIVQLRRELAELGAYATGLEKIIAWMKSGDYAPGKEPPFAVGRRPETGSAAGEASAPAAGPASAARPMSPTSSASGTFDIDDESFGASGTDTAERIVQLDKRRAELQNAVDSLQEKLETAEAQRSELAAQRARDAEHVKLATEEAQRLRLQLEQTEARQREELKRVTMESSSKMLEIEAALDELDAIERQLVSAREQSVALQSERDVVTQRLKAAEEELGKMRAAGGGSPETLAQLQSYQEQAKQLRTQVSEYEKRQSDMELENEDLHEYVAALEQEKDQVALRVTELTAELESRGEQLQAMESRMRAAQARAVELESQMQGIAADAAAQKGKLDAQVRSLDQQCQDLRARTTELSERTAALEAQLAGKEETANRLREANVDLEGTVATLQESLAKLRARLGDASAAGSDDSTAAISSLVEKLKEETAAAKAAASTAQARVDAMRREHEIQVHTLQEQRNALQHQLDEQVSSLQAEHKRVAAENAALSGRLAEAETERAQATERVASLEAAARTLQTQREQSALEASSAIGRLESEQTRTAAALRKNDEINAELAALRAEYDALALRAGSGGAAGELAGGSPAELAALQQQLELVEKERSRVEGLLRAEQELSAKLQHDASQGKSLAKIVEQKNTYIASLESDVEALRSQSGTRNAELEQLRGAYESESAERKKLAEEVERLRRENEALQAKVGRVTRVLAPVALGASGAGGVAEAFAVKEEFGQHLLRKTGSSLLDAARMESERAAARAPATPPASFSGRVVAASSGSGPMRSPSPPPSDA